MIGQPDTDSTHCPSPEIAYSILACLLGDRRVEMVTKPQCRHSQHNSKLTHNITQTMGCNHSTQSCRVLFSARPHNYCGNLDDSSHSSVLPTDSLHGRSIADLAARSYRPRAPHPLLQSKQTEAVEEDATDNSVSVQSIEGR